MDAGTDGLTHVFVDLSVEQIASLQRRNPGCGPSLHRVGTLNVGRLHASGVPILAGTDAGLPGTAAGGSMFAELTHLVRAGLTPAGAGRRHGPARPVTSASPIAVGSPPGCAPT